MIPVCTDCRIAVVRKRITDPETRTVRVVTSIWVFSDDTQVRMELRMQDEHMYIPYASYFSPAKVSITVPCELRFYDVAHAAGPARVAQTSWVNYVFDSPQCKFYPNTLTQPFLVFSRKKTSPNPQIERGES